MPRRPEPAPAKKPKSASLTVKSLRAAPWLGLALMVMMWPSRAEGSVEAQIRRAEPGRGRDARAPQHIPARGWRDILWRTWNEFNTDQIVSVSGGVTFFGLLAMFPAIGAFVALYGLFADVGQAQKQLGLLVGVLPHDILAFVGTQMIRIAGQRDSGLSVAFAVSLLLSLWSANAGMKALIRGLNISYGEHERRGYVRVTLISLAFTVGALAFLILALAGVVAIPLAFAVTGLDPGVFSLLRWPGFFLVVVVGLALLYRYGPSRQHARWRWVSWGSVVAAAMWVAGSLVFSVYLNNFAHYDRTYGAFGALFGAMIWLWMSAIIVLLGAELNAEIEHQTAVDSTTGAPLPLGARGAVMADTVGKALD